MPDNDSYTGGVIRGGPPAVRELGGVVITKLSVGPMDNNAYLLRCRRTGHQLLIDAANDADRLLALAGDDGLDAIVTTHQHRDHWQALAEVAAATGARSIAHEADAAALPVSSQTVADGGVVQFGDCRLEVIHIVGHTPGSIALLYRDHGDGGTPHLFTGDSLFPGGPGRTTSPEDFTSIMTDLEDKIFGRLPDATWFYPGHGKDSKLGAERPAVPQWRERGW